MPDDGEAFLVAYCARLKRELGACRRLAEIFDDYAGGNGARLAMGLLFTTTWGEVQLKSKLGPDQSAGMRSRKLARQQLKRQPWFSGHFPIEWELFPKGTPAKMRAWIAKHHLAGRPEYPDSPRWLKELGGIKARRPGQYNTGFRPICIKDLAASIEEWTGKAPGSVRFTELLNAANRAAGYHQPLGAPNVRRMLRARK